MPDLTTLAELERAATPGPWNVDGDSPRIEAPAHDICTVASFIHCTEECRANRDLIIAMRNALPALLRVAEAAQKLHTKLKAVTGHPTYTAAFVCAQNHRQPYEGPTYHPEYQEMDSALAALGGQ